MNNQLVPSEKISLIPQKPNMEIHLKRQSVGGNLSPSNRQDRGLVNSQNDRKLDQKSSGFGEPNSDGVA